MKQQIKNNRTTNNDNLIDATILFQIQANIFHEIYPIQKLTIQELNDLQAKYQEHEQENKE